MNLVFSSDDLLHTTITTEDGQALYLIETSKNFPTRSDTVIYRLKDDFQIEIGRIKWRSMLFPIVNPEASSHGHQIKMENAAHVTMSKRWTAVDNRQYIWKIDPFDLKHPMLVTDYGSKETVVSFNPGSKAFFSQKQKECPSLTIASGFSIDIIDEFVTTFLKFEQQERDRVKLAEYSAGAA